MPALLPAPYRPNAAAVLAVALPLAGWALDTAQLRRRLHTARRDPLTGLPRRPELTARGEQLAADRHAGTAAAVFLDANGFKELNDCFGHAAGDAVLVALARRLDAWCTARHGMAAAFGGDEFAAAVCIPRPAIGRELAALHQELARPVLYEGRLLPVSMAIGAAFLADMPGRSWSLALRAADVAMYRAKHGDGQPCIGTAADAAVESVNGRRPGRGGTKDARSEGEASGTQRPCQHCGDLGVPR